MRFEKEILMPLSENITKFADRNAFCIDDKFYTYHDLGKAISKIRKAIQLKNIDDKNIGLVANDDLETYASIFALWFEGKSYVPLHPNQPIDRCKDIISQISTSLVLDSSKESRYPEYDVIATGTLPESDIFDLDNIKGNDEDLAYILFTSGSTGKPKGVMLTRNNVAAFIDSFFNLHYKFSNQDRFLQCTDLTFDVSVVSYLVPILSGACMYTVPLDSIKYLKVYELLEEYNLTAAFMVPSVIRYLRPYFDEIELPDLRYCIFAGEGLHMGLVNEWTACAPNATMINAYGPTEGTVYVSAYNCSLGDKNHNGIYSIGKSFKNTTLVIVDENSQIIDDSKIGELCMSGEQQFMGYINNPEKNKEVFFTLNGTKYYRTGDLCYKDADEDILYVGRKDSQVKIQGFRIELSEIEHHAMTFLKGKNVIAIAFENAQMLTEIALFIESAPFDSTDLLNYMKSKMPSYMIPSHLLFKETFPLNANGKTDKIELKKLIK